MRRPSGFTLIEMVVVLAILGVVAAVVITRGRLRSEGLEARAAAGALVQNLRAARAQAIATDRPVDVLIDPLHGTIRASGRPPVAVERGLALEVLPPALPAPGRTRIIRFSPDGSASGGTVVMRKGRQKLAVAVAWLSGQVHVEDESKAPR